MQQLVQYIVEKLVDNPQDVEVSVVDGPRSVSYEISVADEDLGKVIGRGGRIANALRTIVRSVPTEDGRRHSVEISS